MQENLNSDDKVSQKSEKQSQEQSAEVQEGESKTATEVSKESPVADCEDEPPVVKKKKVSETKEVVVAAVDEYANAIQVQGGSSSDQSSPISAESAI